MRSAGSRVSAHVSMSRTKKSGSTAHRRTSVSSSAGSGCVPAAIAAASRVDEFPAANAAITCVTWGFPSVGFMIDHLRPPVKTLSRCEGQAEKLWAHSYCAQYSCGLLFLG
ncbi:Uncharacterised protein [Mycobacteroides abscessus subsp. abscessus]|nr:Uncharacterised protein [Mycobacteroides abscessus subsp. abscessus]